MCAGAMVNARIGRLVYGATDPKAGAAGVADEPRRRPAAQPSPSGRQRRRGRPLRRPVGRVLRRPPPLISPVASLDGRMPERTNGTASKAVEVFGPPWVRIPLLPLAGVSPYRRVSVRSPDSALTRRNVHLVFNPCRPVPKSVTPAVTGPGEPVSRVRGRTREEALRRRAEALTKALTEHPRPSTTALGASSTIAEFAASWLNTVAAVRVRPSSLGKYVDRVERITAWLGDVRIGSLRAEQVATWQSELLRSLSPRPWPTPEQRSDRSSQKR